LVVVVGLLGLLIACAEHRDITYTNLTSSRMTLFLNGRAEGTIDTNESMTRRSKKGSQHIEAYDAQGSSVFDETLTWDELKELNFEIVIDGE
jgi:hypothetical protein